MKVTPEWLIGFLGTHLGWTVWWASKMSARVKTLEERQARLDLLPEKVAEISADVRQLVNYHSKHS